MTRSPPCHPGRLPRCSQTAASRARALPFLSALAGLLRQPLELIGHDALFAVQQLGAVASRL